METQEVKSLIEEQGRLFTQFRERVDHEIAEVKKLGVVLPETKAAIDAMNARFDELEVKFARPKVVVPQTEDGEQKSVQWRAWEKWMRYGLHDGKAFMHMDAEERAAFNESKLAKNFGTKAIANTSEALGGAFVPEDYQATVLKKIANLAGVSAMVSHQSTGRDVLRWPRINYTTDNIDTSGLTMTWEDEAASSTTTDTLGLTSISIPVKKATDIIVVDRELLEDTAVDAIGLLSNLMADKINVEMDRVFTLGAGGLKPEGFMVNPDVSTTNSGTSGAFTFNGLIDLTYALPAQYAESASFMTRRASMAAIRKLVDGTGRYIWEPSTQVGTPPSLLGHPIKANEHIAAIAAAARAMIFGDFKRLYMVADKVGLSVQRLDELYAATDQVGFRYRLRVGGGVVAPWAAQIQVLS